MQFKLLIALASIAGMAVAQSHDEYSIYARDAEAYDDADILEARVAALERRALIGRSPTPEMALFARANQRQFCATIKCNPRENDARGNPACEPNGCTTCNRSMRCSA